MNNFELLGNHYFSEVLHPSSDSNAWLAYLVLKELYPSTTYWSYDGYHVDALVDYDRCILWEGNWIKLVDRTVMYKKVKCLHKASTVEILKEWREVI